ncbi:8-oxo-dGTP pyrophosphatase MutT (NUDIX family) [Sagittula marina]|uniref:8-oxo-dGTP pyrophosphatase MutT (NUDIX family) n=1 Tax=Sagittula marina TaxID=943940 RepID=A0A7W6DUD3_9RHOB|nr:8-oxo-dGTP pyrophosphatase MutT (NUDIX family) [Sagittula marina]
MLENFKSFWGDFVQPIYQRPKRLQLAALCYRFHGDELQVLLITSRDTGRWVVPKGWPMKGKDSTGTALQEAWEEAGVFETRAVGKRALGSFVYEKRLKRGWSQPIEVWVYSAEVVKMCADFPEAHERKLRWFTPAEAAARVLEPGLKKLILDFDPKVTPQNT